MRKHKASLWRRVILINLIANPPGVIRGAVEYQECLSNHSPVQRKTKQFGICHTQLQLLVSSEKTLASRDKPGKSYSISGYSNYKMWASELFIPVNTRLNYISYYGQIVR